MPTAAQKRVRNAFKRARGEGLKGKALGGRIRQLLGGSRAGAKSSKRPAAAKRKRKFSPAQIRAQKAFARMARAKHVRGKPGRRSGKVGRRVGRKQSGARRVVTSSRRQSTLLETPGFGRVPTSRVVRGDTHATPSPLLNGHTEHNSNDPFVPRIADGAVVNTNELQVPLLRR